MKQVDIVQLKEKGITILDGVLSVEWLDKLTDAIDESFITHRNTQIANGNDIKTEGVALHVLLSDPVFVKLLEHLLDIGLIQNLRENFFGANCILNSLSALNNVPNQPNFSSIVHRDLRFYSGQFPAMLNCLIMIDDFTIENGGTYLLPHSHLKIDKPTNEIFFDTAIQAVGKRGSILIFDSNVWHASALNITNDQRRAIPLTICRSFMKQLLDYPRALGYDKMNSFSKELQQFLGYHSRVPASLDEWYQPEDKRFYKRNQD